MMHTFFFLLVLAVSCTLTASQKIVGYIENWAQYRPSPTLFAPSVLTPIAPKIDVINIAFAVFKIDISVNPPVIHSDWNIYPSEYNDTTVTFPQAVALKSSNPHLKVLLSIGGASFTNPNSSYGRYSYTYFATMTADSTSRAQFINSCIDYCTNYGLDGIDIDWEYPGKDGNGGTAADYQSFLDFLSDLYTAMKAANSNWLVTIAAPPFIPNNSVAGTYVVSGVQKTLDPTSNLSYFTWLGYCSAYVDWMNVMCYDYYGTWDNTTGDNSPLYAVPSTNYSVDTTMAHYLAAGIDPTKIVIGIPVYASTFAGVNFSSGNYGTGNTFTGPGAAGKITQQPGTLAYYEVLNALQGPPTIYPSVAYNSSTGVCNAYNASNPGAGLWMTTDTGPLSSVTSSLAVKGQYIKTKGVLGAMLYPISMDLFWQSGNNELFPFCNAVYTALNTP